MSRSYKTLATVTFGHTYYTDGRCKDILMQPTPDTAALMPRYRLLFGMVDKRTHDSYQLLQEYTGSTPSIVGSPLIALPDTYTLRFSLALTNVHFPNFTADAAASGSDVFYFENQSDGESLLDTAMRKMPLIAGAAHIVHAQLTGAATITVTPPGGAATWTVAAYQDAGVWQARVNLEGKAPGIYGFTWTGLTGTCEMYYDPQLAAQRPFGILHLHKGGGLDIAGNDYAHEFAARAIKWKYFFFLKDSPHTSEADYATYNANTGLNGVFEFVALSSGNYEAETGLTSQEIDALKNGANVKAYISDVVIPFREAARPSVQLAVQPVPSNPPTSVIIPNLPNPGVGSPTATVFVHVEKP